MAQSSSNKKVANSLVAASAAAVLAVYAAGYARTRSAADQFDAQSAERRPAPSSTAPVSPTSPDRPAAPSLSAPASAPKGNAVPEERASLEHAPSMVSVPAVASPLPSTSSPASAQPAEPASAVPAAPAAVSAAAPTVAVATPVLSTPEPAPATTPKWKDGTYTGWGTCRHGDIQAAVVIEAGRIKEATITQCLTRYSCDIIGRLPPEVAQRQSGEVDYVSGATQSTNAFYYAVAEALGKAKLQ